jgi:hypothetical protein
MGGGACACDDGDPCNGIETCEPMGGACVAGAPLVCPGGDDALGAGACIPNLGCPLSVTTPAVLGPDAGQPLACVPAEEMDAVREVMSAAAADFQACEVHPCSGVTGDCRSRPSCGDSALCLGSSNRMPCVYPTDQPCYCYSP